MTNEPQTSPAAPPTAIREWTQSFVVLAITAAGVFLAWLPLDNRPSMMWEVLVLGGLIGTAASHITLSGVWGAMGDRSWLVRVVTSAVWVIALFDAFCLNSDAPHEE